LLWKRLFNLPGLRGLLGAENREMLSFGLWLAPLTTGAGSDVPFGMADGIVVVEIGIISFRRRLSERINLRVGDVLKVLVYCLHWETLTKKTAMVWRDAEDVNRGDNVRVRKGLIVVDDSE